jgi:hypothetical protein
MQVPGSGTVRPTPRQAELGPAPGPALHLFSAHNRGGNGSTSVCKLGKSWSAPQQAPGRSGPSTRDRILGVIEELGVQALVLEVTSRITSLLGMSLGLESNLPEVGDRLRASWEGCWATHWDPELGEELGDSLGPELGPALGATPGSHLVQRFEDELGPTPRSDTRGGACGH